MKKKKKIDHQIENETVKLCRLPREIPIFFSNL